MSPEAFFRLCDKSYTKEISCTQFKYMIQKSGLKLPQSTLNNIITIFDEDLNGTITIKEFYNVLDSYGARGEENSPFDDDPDYISF